MKISTDLLNRQARYIIKLISIMTPANIHRTLTKKINANAAVKELGEISYPIA